MTRPQQKPPWIRSLLPVKNKIGKVTQVLRTNCLATVCEEAACPNRAECFCQGTATFMIMGNLCTRDCHFCNVTCGRPTSLDVEEPNKLANAVKGMGLKYVVITSVTRDDLADGGVRHFARCIDAIRQLGREIKVEILTPDFRGCVEEALGVLAQTPPDVFNHNIETISRLYGSVCPSASYELSLQLLKMHKQVLPNIPTKSGIMVGLGETDAEVIEVLKDLRKNNVDRLTIGQYLQPTIKHLPVERYVTPEQFVEFARIAKELGFVHVSSGPLVRSSYHADRA